MTGEREVLNFIDGAYGKGTGQRFFADRNPATGQVIARVFEAGAGEVDAAVAAARRATAGAWAQMDAARRAKVLHGVADGIMARLDDFVAAEVADTGKPFAPTAKGEVPRAAQQFRLFADMVALAPEQSLEMALGDGGRARSIVQRAPRGVIAVICPWNLPLMLLSWKVAPALACGNSVVVKPSEETPASAALLGEVMAAAGVPRGVYNVVHGSGPGAAGEFLTRHPDVDAITFTGETATGEAIMQAAAVGVRDVSLELGGKNAGIVFADCDLERAIAGEAMAVFHNCGQICLGNERLYVERPVFDAFVEGLKQRAESLVMGDPHDPKTRLGPLISRAHRDKVLSYFQKARGEGACVVTGGSFPDMPAPWADGAWIEPTIWTGLSETSAVVREEIFGPCCHIRPFDDEDEVIGLVNDSPYGLTATVWTSDLDRASRVSGRLAVGVVWLNSWMLRDLRTPFGGRGLSGVGREGGASSLDFYSQPRTVCARLG